MRRAGWRKPATACSCSSADGAGRSENFPRDPTIRGSGISDHPELRNGWFDLRMFPNMSVVQGAGVGGGSLVYANISVDAKPGHLRQRAGRPRSRSRAGAALRARRRDARRSAGAAGAVAGAHAAAARRRRRRRAGPTGSSRSIWRSRFDATGATTARSARRRALEDVHQRARRAAGHVRASRQLRHRLRRQRPQHARPQLPRRSPSSNGAEIRPLHLVRHVAPDPRPAAIASRSIAIAGSSLAARQRARPGSSCSAPARSDRPSCCCDRATWRDAAERQRVLGLQLEQQRRLPDAGDSSAPRCCRQSDARADDHRGDQPARRRRPGQRFFIEDGGFPDIARRAARSARRPRRPDAAERERSSETRARC